jgi:hypothetical protein
MNPPINGSATSPIIADRALQIEDRRRLRLDEPAGDQNAGGGRINRVVAGRKISGTLATVIAKGAAVETGATAAVWVLTPA